MFDIVLSKDVDFTQAIAGGALIAVSSSLFLALTGKISGMSGVLHAWVTAKNQAQRGWRLR